MLNRAQQVNHESQRRQEQENSGPLETKMATTSGAPVAAMRTEFQIRLEIILAVFASDDGQSHSLRRIAWSAFFNDDAERQKNREEDHAGEPQKPQPDSSTSA